MKRCSKKGKDNSGTNILICLSSKQGSYTSCKRKGGRERVRRNALYFLSKFGEERSEGKRKKKCIVLEKQTGPDFNICASKKVLKAFRAKSRQTSFF